MGFGGDEQQPFHKHKRRRRLNLKTYDEISAEIINDIIKMVPSSKKNDEIITIIKEYKPDPTLKVFKRFVPHVDPQVVEPQMSFGKRSRKRRKSRKRSRRFGSMGPGYKGQTSHKNGLVPYFGAGEPFVNPSEWYLPYTDKTAQTVRTYNP
jgi:hypothetical protein